MAVFIIGGIILILCAAALGFFFSEDRAVGAFWSGVVVAVLLFWTAVITVAVHFIGKYW